MPQKRVKSPLLPNKPEYRSVMTFNYRFLPAIMRAYSLIQDGALGQIYRFLGRIPAHRI
jgi:predicted dehydrogenase